MKLPAHITKVQGQRKEQSLKEHCIHTAEYASYSIGSTKLYHITYLAGILHDMGKGKKEFADYLEKVYEGQEVKRGSVNHTFAAVIWLLEKYHTDSSTAWEKLTSEIAAYAAGAHHGMFDCVDLEEKNGFLHRLRKDRKDIGYEEAADSFFTQIADEVFIDSIFEKAVQEVKDFFESAKNRYQNNAGKVYFQISMSVRLILSAVIYGDRKDTHEFMIQKACKEQYTDWTKERDYFEQKIRQLDTDSRLNQVRCEISKQCCRAAERASGIYRLNVPTGAGKTLCTLRYALAHAQKYQKKRIIFIIPLLSVLDQNVKVIKDYLPDEHALLEHHSNVVREDKEQKEEGGGQDTDACGAGSEAVSRYEFLGESWNYPIVVSTLVQLLNILFSSRMSAAARMQALCDSVIVIDEVQTLPKKTTVMFNMALNFLQQYCGAAVVLSSATQPCFEQLKWPLYFAEKPDLVCLSEEQKQVFQRAEMIDRTDKYGMDWEECTKFCLERIEEHASLLVICNTKAEAAAVFANLLAQAEDWDIYHLSTAMCQKHRLEVLDKLKESLNRQQAAKENQNIRKTVCISTQLVEAGVDLSFECVVRVLAGIDNLAQAAGRCNRSNEYGKLGKVYLINLKHENLGMLKEIQNAQNSTRKVIAERNSIKELLTGEQAAKRFYQYLFEETKNEIRYPYKVDKNSTVYLTDLLSNNNSCRESEQSYILRQPLKTIGAVFTVFDENTMDVVVPHGDGAKLIEQLKELQEDRPDFEKLKKTVKQAQQYTVSIYEWQRKKLDQAGLLYRMFDDRVFVLDEKAYDEKTGLVVAEEQAAGNYII